MNLWNGCDYLLMGATEARTIFDLVWRFDLTCPGFCLLDVGTTVHPRTLRSWMVALKQQLSEINLGYGQPPFVFRSMSRFDQQETTKFHLDGGPDRSLLIMGYEPSKVQSRLFLADYARAAFDLGIEPKQFLRDFNPMLPKNEELLRPFVTELPQPDEGHSRILVVNNSSASWNGSRTNPLGVMHKAIIANPMATQQRIVNSMMLVLEGEEVSAEKQEEFLTTDRISERNY